MPDSESSFPPPLPTPELYQKLYSHYEDTEEERINAYNASIGAPPVEWNAWVDVMQGVFDERSPVTNEVRQEARWHYQTLAQLGDALAVPEIDNTHARVQHAFARGFLQQQRIIDMMYGGKISFSGTFAPVAAFASSGSPHELAEREAVYALRREKVTAMGRIGLGALEYARGFIEKWSQEVYTPATFQHYVLQDIFKMGHGVAVFGARAVHEQVNQTREVAELTQKFMDENQSKSDNPNTGDTE